MLTVRLRLIGTTTLDVCTPPTARTHQVCIDGITVEQNVSDFDTAGAKLHVELVEVHLELQKSPEVFLDEKFEDPLKGPVARAKHGRATSKKRKKRANKLYILVGN